MKDDKFEAIKRLLSGSMSSLSDASGELTTENVIEAILSSPFIEDELRNSASPYYALSQDEKHYWLLNVNLKTLQKIPAGIEVIPVGEEGMNKMLCMIGHSTFIIPNDIIDYVGWN